MVEAEGERECGEKEEEQMEANRRGRKGIKRWTEEVRKRFERKTIQELTLVLIFSLW